MPAWRRLTFSIPAPCREDLIVALHEEATLGLETAGDRLCAWFAAETVPSALLDSLRARMGPAFAELRLEESRLVPDGFWHERWMEALEPFALGERFLVVPGVERESFGRAGSRRSIRMTPGRAFGTGDHPTTRLCVALMEDAVRAGDRLLDVGTGSGILAIAGRMLGAAWLLGLDTDAEAIAVAARNVAINRVDGIRLVAGSLDTLRARPFDVVVANLSATALLRLMGPLEALTGREAILSGILREEQADVAAAAARAGLATTRQLEEGDWAALCLESGRHA